jgi:hypothetical protein
MKKSNLKVGEIYSDVPPSRNDAVFFKLIKKRKGRLAFIIVKGDEGVYWANSEGYYLFGEGHRWYPVTKEEFETLNK